MAHTADPFAGMTGLLTTSDELDAVIGKPVQAVIDKVQPRLDDLCKDFIAASRFCLIGTAGSDGHLDISPKGDPAGFVKVLSDTMVAIPDRPGNRRVDTFHNVLQNDRVGVLFMVPGKGETLRIRGRARISSDPSLLEPMAVNGKPPRLALLIHVEAAFIHCPKCIMRSQIWQPENWGESGDVADIGTMMITHAKLNQSRDEHFEWAKKQGFLDLY